MKAGCPVWQTVSCTLKAKVVVLNGHWKRANRKTWMDEQVSYRDVFLQPIHVEAGNVWTDVWGTMWKKNTWNQKEDSAVKHWRRQYSILFKPQQIIVCHLAAKRVASTTVSVRLGDLKVPSCGFFLITADFTVWMKAFNPFALLNTIN